MVLGCNKIVLVLISRSFSFPFLLINFSALYPFIRCMYYSRGAVSLLSIVLVTCLSSLYGALILAVLLVHCRSFCEFKLVWHVSELAKIVFILSLQYFSIISNLSGVGGVIEQCFIFTELYCSATMLDLLGWIVLSAIFKLFTCVLCAVSSFPDSATVCVGTTLGSGLVDI